MTTKQENKMSMYLTTRDYTKGIEAEVNTLPGFTEHFGGFENSIVELQKYRDVQEGDNTGFAGQKTQLKDALIVTTMDVVRKLAAFASNTNNLVLGKEIGYVESDLRKAADTLLRDKAQLVYNKAVEQLPSLAPYLIDQPLLDGFLAAIQAYEKAIPKPKLSKNEAKIATENINKTFALADEQLAKLDKVMGIIQLAKPGIYNGYTKARALPTSGSGSLALKGSVKDANGNSVANVEIKIAGAVASPAKLAAGSPAGSAPNTTNAVQLTKKTGDKGAFQEKNLADGTYTATATKNGYKPQTINFTVTGGEMTKVDIVMEKE
jgi:hypothetical protein